MAVAAGALLGLISTGGGAYLFGATLWASVLTGASLGYAFSSQDIPGTTSPTYSFGEISNTKTQLLPVPVVYGHCRVAGNVFYCRYYDDQKQKADQYIGISEGPIQGITEVMAGDQLIEDLSECSLDVYLNSDSSTSDKRDPEGDVQRPYPNDFAFIATTLKAQEKYRGNEPITSIADGRIVWTPTGLRWTSNPAWIIRDFLTNKRYGFGIPVDLIDDVAFAEAADYCDGAPIDGTAPRFTLNGVIDTKKKGIDHLKEMLSCCRGFIVGREKIALRIEGPVTNYDAEIGPDNIVKGTFSWWQSGNDEILNRVIIQWVDPDNSWEQTTTIFENTDDIVKRGIVDKTFSLNWITSAEQAARMGAFLLDGSNAVTNFCSFQLGLKKASVEVGDVIALTHPLPGWDKKWMRVSRIDDGKDNSITVICSEYVAEVYNDRAMDFPVHVDTNLPNPWTCPDVIGLTATERVTVDSDGTVLSDIDLFWTDPDVLLRSVEVLVLEAGSVTWKSCGSVLPGVGNFVIRGLASNQLVSVMVRPVNTAGIKAVGEAITLTLYGKAEPPGAPTGLAATGGFQVAEIAWVNPTDADLKHIEVWESQDDTQENSYKAADVDGTSLTRSNLSNLTTYWYWIRAVDTSGNVSGWVGPVSATTETIQAPDIPEGLIDPPMLGSELREPIERIPGIEVDIEDITVEVGNIKDISIPGVNANIRDSIQRLSERVSELDEGYVEQLRQAGSGAIRTLLQLRNINKKLTDAGIVVDPSTGQVQIWAVDQLRNEYNIRLSETEITVDALASSINSKATLSDVDARIAEAVFGDVGELLVSGLQAQITTVEESLNAVEGTLTEKASAVDVDEIGGRVTTAESRLNGLDADIALKASSEEVGALDSRVTSAESTIDGFTGAVTDQVVALSQDGRDLSNLSAEGVIRNVLNANNDRKAKNIQLALAKESLKAYTDQGLAAEAQQRLDLAAVVGDNHAELIEEKNVRSSQNEAVVESIELLSAKTDQNDARITSETTARTDGDSALSGRIDTVQAKTAENEAAIQTETQTRANETGALAEEINTLQTRTGSNESAIQEEREVRSNETSATGSAVSTLVSESDASLGESVIKGILQLAKARALIKTERSTRTNEDEALATLITTLQAELGDTQATIQEEQTVRATADSANASEIQTVMAQLGDEVNNRKAAVQSETDARVDALGAVGERIDAVQTKANNNTAAIQTEANARANAVSAITSQVNTIQSTVGDHTASIQTNATAVANVDGLLKAQYVIKVNANGKVAGIGLVTDGEASEFAINADRLLLVDPNGGSDIPPFVVGTDPETGVASLYLNGDLFAAGTIKGEHINAASTISLAGGAILLDGQNGVVRISDPNDLTQGDYLTASNGELSSYSYLGGSYRRMKSLRRIETGIAQNNTATELPGYWPSTPKILCSPSEIPAYSPSFSAQVQTWQISATNINWDVTTKKCSFVPLAKLVVAGGVVDLSGAEVHVPFGGSGEGADDIPYTKTISITIPAGATQCNIGAYAFAQRIASQVGGAHNLTRLKVTIKITFNGNTTTLGVLSMPDSYKDIESSAGDNYLSVSGVIAFTSASYARTATISFLVESAQEGFYSHSNTLSYAEVTNGWFKVSGCKATLAPAEQVATGTVNYIAVGE